MPDIPDPNGMLARATYLFKKLVDAGAISTTVRLPIPGHDYFVLAPWPTWPAGGFEASRTSNTIVITWQNPCPPGGGILRGTITV